MNECKVIVEILMEDGRIMRGIAELKLLASVFEDNLANSQRLAENVVHSTFTKLAKELNK